MHLFYASKDRIAKWNAEFRTNRGFFKKSEWESRISISFSIARPIFANLQARMLEESGEVLRSNRSIFFFSHPFVAFTRDSQGIGVKKRFMEIQPD